MKPADKFWPLARYKAMYGDPSAPRNKQLKHKVCRMGGYLGVLVPGDDGSGPWEVVTRAGHRAEKDDEMDVGDDGGDEEQAREAFSGCRQKMRLELQEAASGAMQDVLNLSALSAEEAANEEHRAKRNKFKKKAKAKKAEQEKPMKPSGFFDFTVDADDEEDDDADQRRASVNNKKNVRSAAALPPSTPSGKTKALTKAASGAGAALVVEDPGSVESKGRGALKKDVLVTASKFWDDFATATDASPFFCRACLVQGMPNLIRGEVCRFAFR